jgi:hypothetical protein
MRAVVLDPVPAEVAELLERRRHLGLDRYDEVREGVYHVVPAPHPRHAELQSVLMAALRQWSGGVAAVLGPTNIGTPEDYRVPDAALVAPAALASASPFLPTALMVFEIVSPGEDALAKEAFYRAADVGALVVVTGTPTEPVVEVRGLHPEALEPIDAGPAAIDVVFFQRDLTALMARSGAPLT